MTRLPRRASRVKPPLRGRASTRHYHGDFAPIASVRRPLRSYNSRPLTRLSCPEQEIKSPGNPSGPEQPHPHEPKPSLYADLVEFYKSWGRFLRSLEKPWQWILAIAIVLSSLLLLNRLL
ncbi:hypothetical protein [Leptothoe spongobia]|uniref:hypothetical protein n=1 Tax=Leptothoe spongobia TaxID=2651728 RepID=UPI001C0118C0|nr:hypothetical protein [Leptothoe spongobia]